MQTEAFFSPHGASPPSLAQIEPPFKAAMLAARKDDTALSGFKASLVLMGKWAFSSLFKKLTAL